MRSKLEVQQRLLSTEATLKEYLADCEAKQKPPDSEAVAILTSAVETLLWVLIFPKAV
jgi:hypothetical protein